MSDVYQNNEQVRNECDEHYGEGMAIFFQMRLRHFIKSRQTHIQMLLYLTMFEYLNNNFNGLGYEANKISAGKEDFDEYRIKTNTE